jgi:SanA protein
MYRHAVSLGVPSEDIVLDYAGRRTYDTCYRAKDIFGVSEAVVVTQRFHLPRAIFLCDHFGIETTGYSSNMSYYRKISRLIWNIRELPATLVALSDAWITRPVPVLGDREPIFPE